MEYVRTSTATYPAILTALRGVQPTTPECNGPYLSSDRGMDEMCCARCNVLRQQLCRLFRHNLYAADVGSFIYTRIALDFLHALEARKVVHESVLKSCIISMCNNPLVYVPPGRSELNAANVREFIRLQMLLWRTMYIDCSISAANLAYTQGGLPVIIPGNDAIISPYTTDSEEREWIRADSETIPKYRHVIRYQEVMTLLFPGEKWDQKEEKGVVWYKVF